IGADGTARERTDTGADQRVAPVIAAGQKPETGACRRSEQRAAGRVRHLLLPRIRVGRAGSGQRYGGEHRDRSGLHENLPLVGGSEKPPEHESPSIYAVPQNAAKSGTA